MTVGLPRNTPSSVAAAVAFLLGLSVPVAGTFASPTDVVRTFGCPLAQKVDPLRLYGDEIRFEVFRDGARVGTHTVTFRRSGADLIVETQFDVEVDVLFITAYRYVYRATDIWRDGCLVDMRASVDDNGDRHSVTATLDGNVLRVTGPSGEQDAPLGTFPTHHWNAGVLASDRVLNTITGRLDDVDIVDQGIDYVRVNGSPHEARHYAYTGDLRTNIWYDQRDRWVKMRFTNRDGSTIDYVCDVCGRELTARQ
jgi:Domain of unknown function (DUF6134)